MSTADSSAAVKNVLIFGGNGRTGRAVATALLSCSKKYTVHSVIRNQDQSNDLQSLGTRALVADLATASVDAMTALIKTSQASIIVWCAGASPASGDPDVIDHKAVIRSLDAAEAAGCVERYIHVSALDVRDRQNREIPPWYNEKDIAGSERLWKVLATFMPAKLASDKNLAARSELNWTILRPGRLTEDDPTGKADCGRVHFGRGISRADLAKVVVGCIEKEGLKGLAFDVVGGDTDIEDAVAEVAEKREDCFQGFF